VKKKVVVDAPLVTPETALAVHALMLEKAPVTKALPSAPARVKPSNTPALAATVKSP
jgi:hypothetical protein